MIIVILQMRKQAQNDWVACPGSRTRPGVNSEAGLDLYAFNYLDSRGLREIWETWRSSGTLLQKRPLSEHVAEADGLKERMWCYAVKNLVGWLRPKQRIPTLDLVLVLRIRAALSRRASDHDAHVLCVLPWPTEMCSRSRMIRNWISVSINLHLSSHKWPAAGLLDSMLFWSPSKDGWV